MAKREGNTIIDNGESQYLQETQEYIERLKDNLIRKILILQQSERNEVNPSNFNQELLAVTEGN
jgi:hypothetical protein